MKPRLIAGAVVVAAIAVVLVLTVGGDDSDDRVATATTVRGATTTTPGPLAGAAAELVALLDRGIQATAHIKYSAHSPEPGAPPIEIELWRKDGRVRQDTFFAATKDHSADFFAPTGGKHCTRKGDGPWSCAPIRGGDAGPVAFLSALRSQLAGAKVSATDATIAGRAVRCFSLDIAAQKARVCLQPSDGLPVAVESDQASLELVSADTNVSDDVFNAPG